LNYKLLSLKSADDELHVVVVATREGVLVFRADATNALIVAKLDVVRLQLGETGTWAPEIRLSLKHFVALFIEELDAFQTAIWGPEESPD